MPIDVLAFLITVLLMVFQGVPRVRRRVWLPLNLEFEQVPVEKLTDKQKKYMDDVDAKLAKLGYNPSVTYRVKNLQGPNLSRSYLNPMEPILINSVLVGTAAHLPPNNTYFLEIITRFNDGTVLTTKNSQTATVFDLLPSRIRQELPRVKDPETLKRKHDQKMEEFRLNGVIYPKAGEIIPRHGDYHGLFCQYQVTRGLLRFDPSAQIFRATTKTGLRGVRNLLNPFDAGFHWMNLLWVLLLGGLVPTAGVYYNPLLVSWAQAATGWNGFLLEWSLLFFSTPLGAWPPVTFSPAGSSYGGLSWPISPCGS